MKDMIYVEESVNRVVKVIEDYVNNYEGMMMGYDGNSASICVGWDIFNEDDMELLIEDFIFALSVRDVLYENKVIKSLDGFLVYDDGVYVSVDAKMFDKVA